MRIILDCNVLVSAVLTKGACREVLARVLREHELVYTASIMEEYLEVFQRQKFQAQHKHFFNLAQVLGKVGDFVEEKSSIAGLPDPDDEKYLQADTPVQMLVTGNQKHFPEKSYGNMKVVSPREFLEMF